ncbi:hypothetical protein CBM2609_B120112 [Cupriavidus taiwanensis]|nr:hypothetical protein CBM2604_B130112 [Cupriavidus taiwanensis]SOZ31153.1 hypothetical protein CBM2609_B120112 [Cupriavidus taiwanensis]SOZ47230.1 hypothetical protein CBM2610_B100112 [Cupriavidus taiwanensis]
MTPHIVPDGSHLTQLEAAAVLKRSALSPLGPVAVNTMAPDEGNMYLLGKVATPQQKRRFLDKLVSGEARSAFFMTEPADEGGAWAARECRATRSSSRCSAKCARSASMTARPKSTSGRWRR